MLIEAEVRAIKARAEAAAALCEDWLRQHDALERILVVHQVEDGDGDPDTAAQARYGLGLEAKAPWCSSAEAELRENRRAVLQLQAENAALKQEVSDAGK